MCGRIRKEPLILVGDGGAVKDGVVFLRDVAAGKPWPEMSGGGRPVLDQKSCRFQPHVQVARRGKIDIVNSDPVLHNTHGYYGKRTAFNVALPIQDGKVTKLLRSAGEVRVDCDAHGWMLAWIYVVDNPYFAQTGDDGKFSITGRAARRVHARRVAGGTGGDRNAGHGCGKRSHERASGVEGKVRHEVAVKQSASGS